MQQSVQAAGILALLVALRGCAEMTKTERETLTGGAAGAAGGAYPRRDDGEGRAGGGHRGAVGMVQCCYKFLAERQVVLPREWLEQPSTAFPTMGPKAYLYRTRVQWTRRSRRSKAAPAKFVAE